MRRKCRIWWPENLSVNEPSSAHFLFGWFVSSSSVCVDIVVGFACNEVEVSRCQSSLQEIIRCVDGKLPVSLQDKSMFSLLGQGKMLKLGMQDGTKEKSCTDDNSVVRNMQDVSGESHREKSCECDTFDCFVDRKCDAFAKGDYWIQLVYHCHKEYGRGVRWLPKLDHIHWNGETVSQFDVHVIVYETPLYGSHHFSLNSWSPEQAKAPPKKPKWVDELDYKKPLFKLETVITGVNSAAAAKVVIKKHMDSNRASATFWIINLCLDIMWHIFAISIASVSTLFYVTLQFFYILTKLGSRTKMYSVLAWTFRNTWTNIQIRCCQMLYWPIFLRDNGLRSQSCVKYAEHAALLRHSMWLSVTVDLLLGNVLGLSILYNAESVCSWISTFANDFTNELLRSGCVWLMGVPAGFKLNTELAGVLGVISLNVIQIWSTLWIFVSFLVVYFMKGLAVLAIMFGAAIPAALIIDSISIGTLHVSTLHCAMSLIYSHQIQALAALWRLFRGRKWNPLRTRLDSYDYTVKQHIVGSLLFTPLLLLLPTTSVFYIFFTILDSAITFICILIEVTISMIHGEEESSVLVSVLHSNFLTLGQVVLPHYKKIFCGVSSFVISSAYGALTGKKTSSTLGAGLPSKIPWMVIPAREYWLICYNSILTCRLKTE
ncbi:N-acetylglucosaminyl transferase component family protein / Gpi1 family protein [Euphorbia peplus]|nr:N-acetylglucosaminyl transferase component family protein / Gpi1 family protein [Euphorbia peplus]